jgi:hypothetical protein
MKQPQAAEQPRAAPVERRTWVRFSARLKAVCAPQGFPGGDTRWWRAIVTDVSAGGLAMLLDRPAPPRAVLAVRLRDACYGDVALPLARVVRAAARGDGHWVLACEFAYPLHDEELRALPGDVAAGRSLRAE